MNDDQNREGAAARTSSQPPSIPPPSQAPSTDEIDSDWGGESAEPAKPAVAASPSASKPPRPTSSAPPSMPQSPASPAALPKANPKSARHSGTLIGLVAPGVPLPASESPKPAPVEAAAENPPNSKPPIEAPPEAQPAAEAAEPPKLSEPPKVSEPPNASEPSKAKERPPLDSPPSSTAGLDRSDERYHSVPAPRHRRGGVVSLALLAAAVALGIVGFWFVLGPGRDNWQEQAAAAIVPAATPAPVQATAEAAEIKPAAAEIKQAPEPAPTSEPAPAATPSATASAAASDQPASAGAHVVTVVTRPEGAKLFYKGKEVGVTPMKVELAPGEKRSFEVALPGHITRKLVVDGDKPEVVIGLRPTN